MGLRDGGSQNPIGWQPASLVLDPRNHGRDARLGQMLRFRRFFKMTSIAV